MIDDFEAEYAGRFDWRRARQISNLQELASFQGAGGDPLDPPFMNYLEHFIRVETVEDAPRHSIYLLFPEASQTYVLGFFQASLLASGAVLERVLKLEYRVAHGSLSRGKWTLGKLIYNSNLDWGATRVRPDHLKLIEKVKGPRNSRAHALLEHESPKESRGGGPNRGIEILRSGHYQIEPFRGEAKGAISAVYSILSELYKHEPPPVRQPTHTT